MCEKIIFNSGSYKPTADEVAFKYPGNLWAILLFIIIFGGVGAFCIIRFSNQPVSIPLIFGFFFIIVTILLIIFAGRYSLIINKQNQTMYIVRGLLFNLFFWKSETWLIDDFVQCELEIEYRRSQKGLTFYEVSDVKIVLKNGKGRISMEKGKGNVYVDSKKSFISKVNQYMYENYSHVKPNIIAPNHVPMIYIGMIPIEYQSYVQSVMANQYPNPNQIQNQNMVVVVQSPLQPQMTYPNNMNVNMQMQMQMQMNQNQMPQFQQPEMPYGMQMQSPMQIQMQQQQLQPQQQQQIQQYQQSSSNEAPPSYDALSTNNIR